MDEIECVFEELGSATLLAKCVHGGTQNPNEAFHHVIWSRCPKSIFVGRRRLEIAVSASTIVFNSGEVARASIYDKLDLETGAYTNYGMRVQDKQRITDSMIKSSNSKKLQRKEKGVSQPNCLDIETSEYFPGEF